MFPDLLIAHCPRALAVVVSVAHDTMDLAVTHLLLFCDWYDEADLQVENSRYTCFSI